jgi:hypothetical protein
MPVIPLCVAVTGRDFTGCAIGIIDIAGGKPGVYQNIDVVKRLDQIARDADDALITVDLKQTVIQHIQPLDKVRPC